MRKLSVWAVLFVLAAASPLSAQSLTGREIMENVYTRPSGGDMESELTMTLENSRGSARERKIRQFRADFDGVEKKIMFFLAPADVRNTSFMNWSYTGEGRDEDRWIYLPALKRIKRISSESGGDSFMGSDFTYDDLGERHPSLDEHRVLGEETVRGERCYVVESVPLDSDAPYSRTVSWVVKDTWIGMKKEFYDSDGELLKVLSVHEYGTFEGIFVLLEFEMENVQTGHSTRMKLENVTLDSGVSRDMFTERAMQRGIR